MNKIIIIGGGVAGINLLEFLHKRDPKADITLIKREDAASFSTCGLPYFLEGTLKYDDIVLHDEEFYKKKGIDFRVKTDVKEINLDDRTVMTKDESLTYDDLVIATGRKPYVPKIEGIDLKGVYTFNDEIDGLKIKESMKEAKDGVVIGGGSIGLSAAVALAKNGLNTKVLVGHDHVLSSILDPDMAKIVEDRLNEIGIEMITHSKIDSMEGDGRVRSISVNNMDIPAEIVVVSRGTRPNVDLARDARIETGENGGIITDFKMHVKRGDYLKNVYAFGDCVEVIDHVTGRPRLSQLGSTAVIQAKVIADNILGGALTYEPCVSPNATKIADIQVGSVGITSRTAKKFGINLVTGKSKKLTRARYYPGRLPVTVKLLFDEGEKLVGAQVVSGECAAERINSLTIAIKRGMSAREILKMERVFEPALSLLVDATVDAAEDAMNKM
ncbi:MAG: Coenzyme A disulfide reductase [Candidatus Methanolliviera sp. GoM_asphalt]|nr:MAG: Coenzyme A disulfide reductase [Candidatus Methanolliviera sp. GoM_asphalt]